MSVRFLAPVQRSTLRAVGQLIRRGGRQDVAEMRLYDGNDRLVGHATGTFVLLPSIPLGDNPSVPGQSE